MAITDELLDELLKSYKRPEDLIGEHGILKELTKRLVERAMSAELTSHLGYDKHETDDKPTSNRRNGSSKKTILTRDEWEGEIDPHFKGTACAESDEDTLQGLSKLILGTGDAGVGGKTVSKGETVEIAPYLKKLEKKLREKIAAAAIANVNGTFPRGKGAYYDYNSLTIPVDELQNWFNGKNSNVRIDCQGAARVTLAKGLLDTIGRENYKALFDSQELPFFNRKESIGGTKVGDWVYFVNDKRYTALVEQNPNKKGIGGYRGENVIKVNTDSYVGYPTQGTRSYKEWNGKLINAFNAIDPQIQINTIPGYTGFAQFFEVNVIGMKVFDLRKGRSE